MYTILNFDDLGQRAGRSEGFTHYLNNNQPLLSL